MQKKCNKLWNIIQRTSAIMNNIEPFVSNHLCNSFLRCVWHLDVINNNNNNVYRAVIMAEPLREFTRFI